MARDFIFYLFIYLFLVNAFRKEGKKRKTDIALGFLTTATTKIVTPLQLQLAVRVLLTKTVQIVAFGVLQAFIGNFM